MSTNKFCVRINLYDGYESRIKEFFSQTDSYPKVFIGFHIGKTGENPHYHVVFTTDKPITVSTLRKRFKLVFTKGKGNGHISVKEWDGKLDAIGYVYHEDQHLVPTVLHGFTAEEISQAKSINAEHQDKIKSESPMKVLEKVVERLFQAGHTTYTDHYGQVKVRSRWTHEEIFNVIMDAYIEKGDWLPNRFQMERYIMKVQLMLTQDDESRTNVKKLWYSEMFPQRN